MDNRHYFLSLSHSQLRYAEKICLLRHFKFSAKAIFEASRDEIYALCPRLTQAITHYSNQALVERTMDYLQMHPEHQMLVYGESNYPNSLKQIPSPPLVLFYCGHVELLNQPQIAIVGTRHPSHYGQEIAFEYAKALSNQGLVVTSGMANGIDSHAHLGALASALQPSTVAVWGSGIDQCYPKSNYKLAQKIGKNGLIISEFAPYTPPLAKNFPRRNRLISGLSLGCVIIEASIKSGSLISARLANEQGKEVFALPGSIHSPQSKGCHHLIKQGAKLIESIDDIIIEIKDLLDLDDGKTHPTKEPKPQMNSQLDLTDDLDYVLNCVDFTSTSLDLVIARSGLKAEKVSSSLLLLELRGYIKKDNGNQYVKQTKPWN